MPEWFKDLLTMAMAEGHGSRSTVMQSLLWMIGLLVVADCGLATANAPTWMLILFSCLMVLAIVVAIVVFCILVVRSPDLLRSEKYHIRRMEIEQSSIGDSVQGVIDRPSRQPLGLPKPTGDEVRDA